MRSLVMAWKREFPETTVLDMPRTARNYSKEFYRDPQKFVFGFKAGGATWELPMERMIENPVHQFKIKDESFVAIFDKDSTLTRLYDATLDGQALEFTRTDDQHMTDKQTLSRWKIVSGKAISGKLQGKELTARVGIMSFRKAWRNFHPKSNDVDFSSRPR